jgi:hypothetical protein
MADGAKKSTPQAEIERIVRRVLAELTSGAPQGNGQAATSGELVLATKVVSLTDLKGRLDGISRIIVPRGAVITPAARDTLKQHTIAIASAASYGTAAVKPNGQLLIGTAETNYASTALEKILINGGIRCERAAKGELVAVVDRLTDHVAAGRGPALLLTGNPAAAVCLANRKPKVRASLGHDVAAVADAARCVALNLLVVDPRQKNVFELRQMARALVRVGNQPCPSPLDQRLG